MKRFLLSIVFQMVILCAFGADGYSLFKVQGVVMLNKQGTWIVAERHARVQLRQQLRLSEGAKVGVLEESSGRIYYSEEEGTYTVARLISTARKQADAHVADVNRKVVGIMQENTSSAPSYAVVGAVHRGQQDGESTLALCLAFLRVEGGRQAAAQDILLEWNEEEDALMPVFINRSSRPLYFTLLHQKEGKTEVATRFGKADGLSALLVEPEGQQVAEGFLFAKSHQQQGSWILLAAPVAFDSQLLHQYLQRDMTLADETDPIELHVFSSR